VVTRREAEIWSQVVRFTPKEGKQWPRPLFFYCHFGGFIGYKD
jgi:hypothetical protein